MKVCAANDLAAGAHLHYRNITVKPCQEPWPYRMAQSVWGAKGRLQFFSMATFSNLKNRGGGGGGTPLYGLCRYVRPQRVWFSAVLVINRVSILADFGHKLGTVFVLQP